MYFNKQKEHLTIKLGALLVSILESRTNEVLCSGAIGILYYIQKVLKRYFVQLSTDRESVHLLNL